MGDQGGLGMADEPGSTQQKQAQADPDRGPIRESIHQMSSFAQAGEDAPA
jgi:hypothetical protein